MLRELLRSPGWPLFRRLLEQQATQALAGLVAASTEAEFHALRGRYAAWSHALTLGESTVTLYERYYDRFRHHHSRDTTDGHATLTHWGSDYRGPAA